MDDEFSERYANEINQVAALALDPGPHNLSNAVDLIRSLEMKRHNLVGEVFCEVCSIKCTEDISVGFIVDAIVTELSLSDDEHQALLESCDLNKCPDALDYELNQNQDQWIAIIDFKARANIKDAIQGTVTKYEKALANPLSRVTGIKCEVIIVYADLFNSVLGCSKSVNSLKFEQAITLINNSGDIRLGWFAHLTSIIKTIEGKFPGITRELRDVDNLDIRMTPGYFSTEIPIMLDALCDRAKNKPHSVYDDMYRYCPGNENKIRIMCLFCEYYNMDYRFNALFEELRTINNWLINKAHLNKDFVGTEGFCYMAYIHWKLREENQTFREMSDALLSSNVNAYACKAQEIRRQLDNLYKESVEELTDELVRDAPAQSSSFKPDTPTVNSVNDGLQQLFDEITKDKRAKFVHTGSCKINHPFLLPTWTGSKEEIAMKKANPDRSFNSIRHSRILCRLNKMLRSIIKSNNSNSIIQDDHIKENISKVIRSISYNMTSPASFMVSRKESHAAHLRGFSQLISDLVPDDEIDLSIKLLDDYRVDRLAEKKINSFKKVVEDPDSNMKESITRVILESQRNRRAHGDDASRQLDQKDVDQLSRGEASSVILDEIPSANLNASLNFDLGHCPKNMKDKGQPTKKEVILKSFTKVGNVATDGVNFLLGKKRLIFSPDDQCRKRALNEFLIFCGVGKKSLDHSADHRPKVTLYELKQIEEYEKTGSEAYDRSELNKAEIIDCRSELLDYHCSMCKRDADLYIQSLKYYDSIQGFPNYGVSQGYRSKIIDTLREVISSPSYSDLRDVRENVDARLRSLQNSGLYQGMESIETLFSNLLIQSDFNKTLTASVCHSKSPDSLLIRLPGEKLHDTRKNLPYIMINMFDLTNTSLKAIEIYLQTCFRSILYIVGDKHHLFVITKPMRLDLNRLTVLSKSAMRHALIYNALADTTLSGVLEKVFSFDPSQTAVSAMMMATSCSLSQLSIRDPLKYMITLVLADASDISGFFREKFKYSVKSAADLYLFVSIIDMLECILRSRQEIIESNAQGSAIKLTMDTILEGGWKSFNIQSPFTGATYSNVKQFINEIFCNVYCCAKSLHTPETNLMKLLEVPCKFQRELAEKVVEDLDLAKRGTYKFEEFVDRIQDTDTISPREFDGKRAHEYKPDILILSVRARLKNDTFKAAHIRHKIDTSEGMMKPIVQIKTMTSARSSTDVIARSPDLSSIRIVGSRSLDFEDNMRSFLRQSKEVGNLDYKESKSLLNFVLLILENEKGKSTSAWRSQLETLSESLMRHARSLYTGDRTEEEWTNKIGKKLCSILSVGKLNTELFQKYIQLTCDSYILTRTLPVKESLYQLIEAKEKIFRLLNPNNDEKMPEISVVSCIKSDIREMSKRGIKNSGVRNIVRVFPKGQRTHTDREIYIMNMEAKIRLYFIEHVYKHVDKLNEYEVISLPGEAKQKFIADQERDFLEECGTLYIQRKTGERLRPDEYVISRTHNNTDESKWSARDQQRKFNDAHLVALGTMPSEKLAMIMIQENYGIKYLEINPSIMQRICKEINFKNNIQTIKESSFKVNLLRKMTKDGKRNYCIVTSNWLQGNLNYLSSAIHTANAELNRAVHECLMKRFVKQQMPDVKSMKNVVHYTMAHSDDGTTSCAVLLPKHVYDNSIIAIWRTYHRLVFYMNAWLKRKFCITLNLLKTFCSEPIKDFISEFLINGEFIGCYSRYLLNAVGETNFKNYKEDIYMLMAAAQSMLKKDSPLETALVTIGMVNYYVYHTYSMLAGEANDPIKRIKEAIDCLSEHASDCSEVIDHYKKKQVNLKSIDRNMLVICLGGYCSPPLNLLSLYGAKINDAHRFFVMNQTLDSTQRVLRELVVSNTEKPLDTLYKENESVPIERVEETIKLLLSNHHLLPPIEYLIGAFVTRSDLGTDGNDYSSSDIDRLNRVSLHTFPSRIDKERFPVTHPSFIAFLSSIGNSDSLQDSIKQSCSNPEELIGSYTSSQIFRNRQLLSHQIERAYSINQRANTNVQRLDRMITSSKQVFLPINVIDSIDKVKLETSMNVTKSHNLSLNTSLVSILNGRYEVLKSSYKTAIRKHNFDLRDKLSIDMLRVSKALKYQKDAQSLNRQARMEEIKEMGDKVLAPLLLEATLELGYIPENLDVMGMMSRRLTLGESIRFVAMLSLCRGIQEALRSYLMTIIALIFNDRLIHWALVLNQSTVLTGCKTSCVATIQKAWYPFNTKRLFYRAESIVKGVLLGMQDNMELLDPNIKKGNLLTGDLAFVEKIIRSMGLDAVVLWLKTSLQNIRLEIEPIEDMGSYGYLIVYKHLNYVYNLILKYITLYNVKSAYILTRASKSYSAETFFAKTKGDYVVTDSYVETMIDLSIKALHSNHMLTYSTSKLFNLKRILKICVSLLRLCQRVFGTTLAPCDFNNVLRHTIMGEVTLLEVLDSYKGQIVKSAHDLESFSPFLFHMGYISEKILLETLYHEQVLAVWVKAHISRKGKTMIGDYSVRYHYKGITASVEGVGQEVSRMDVFAPQGFELEQIQLAVCLSKIFEKLVNDLRLDWRPCPKTLRKGDLIRRRAGPNVPAEFSIMNRDAHTGNGRYRTSRFCLKVNNFTILYDSGEFNNYIPVIFSLMKNPDINSIEIWNVTGVSQRSCFMGPNTDHQYSIFSGCHMVFMYNEQRRNNDVLNDGIEPLEKQRIRTTMQTTSDNLSMIDIFGSADMAILGISLRAILTNLKQQIMSQSGTAVCPGGNVRMILPGLSDLFEAIQSMEEVGITEVSNLVIADLISGFEKFTEKMKKELVEQPLVEISPLLAPERKVEQTIRFEQITVNIMSRFVSHNNNFFTSINSLIQGLLAWDYLQDDLVERLKRDEYIKVRGLLIRFCKAKCCCLNILNLGENCVSPDMSSIISELAKKTRCQVELCFSLLYIMSLCYTPSPSGVIVLTETRTEVERFVSRIQNGLSDIVRVTTEALVEYKDITTNAEGNAMIIDSYNYRTTKNKTGRTLGQKLGECIVACITDLEGTKLALSARLTDVMLNYAAHSETIPR